MTVIEAGPGVEVALSEDESKRAGRFLQGQPRDALDDAEALHAVDPSLASCGLRKGRVTELVIEDELESLCYQRVGSENWIREEMVEAWQTLFLAVCRQAVKAAKKVLATPIMSNPCSCTICWNAVCEHCSNDSIRVTARTTLFAGRT